MIPESEHVLKLGTIFPQPADLVLNLDFPTVPWITKGLNIPCSEYPGRMRIYEHYKRLKCALSVYNGRGRDLGYVTFYSRLPGSIFFFFSNR